MDIKAIRDYCLSLPATTKKIQWGADLVFKIGGKMYAALVLVTLFRPVLSGHL